MAHLAGTKFAAHFRFDVDLERFGKNLRDLANGYAFADADIDR